MRDLLALVGFIILVLAVSAVAGWFSAMGIPEWYGSLAKPSWTPPSSLFAPVWTTLYVMMAVAAWLVWRQAGLGGATRALTLFYVQLGLNVAWSGLFFGLRSPGLAMVEIVALWVAVLATVVLFFRESRLAGWLLVPYLLWVSFASVLNAAIVRLN
ncbi:MAG: tryptophan-rich sensory protein [Gemmatimonadota bacterium]|jgi:benzodiazapine receptor